MSRPLLALACCVLLALSGCGALLGTSQPAVAPGQSDPAATDGEMADPASDVLGWEDGVWHNESIDVDQSDGLDDAELDAFVARSMARVEYIRRAEFQERVPVSVESRQDYRNRTAGGGGESEAYTRWNDQVWEALFAVGERANSTEEIGETLSSSVAGFYSPSADEIKIITPRPETPTISNTTLVHELTHALQDQMGNLGSDALNAETQDGELAVDGLVEGEASLVERRYEQRCGEQWTCVSTPSPSGGSDGGDGDDGSASSGPNWTIYMTIYQPYSDGALYVEWLRERGGWDAVDAAYDAPPNATEQTIHRTNEAPVPLGFEDRATGGWETFPEQGVDGADTLGETSIFAMFWAESYQHGADAVDWRGISATADPLDVYEYSAPPSAGWGNDKLVPYRNGSEYGYVWETAWDTESDAREFQTAYHAVLRAHDATEFENDTWTITEGEFADAFRVVRNGTRVTVVNGPAVDDLDEIRPNPGVSDPPSGNGDIAVPGVPGFGVLAALAAALLVAGLLSVRRRPRRGRP